MKKVSLLIAMIAFVFGNAFAELSYDFSDGVAGAKIAETYGDPWTTWNNAPGGAEDGVFDEMGGSMAAHFTYGNDQILRLGNLTTGNWVLSFDMYIPNGMEAYNNILHKFNGSNSEWATEVHYKTAQNGTMISANGTTTNFECPFDAWFNVKYEVDLDNDVAAFYVDDVFVTTWQFSKTSEGDDGQRQLGAMDFYPPTEGVSEYYVDNIEVAVQSNDEILLFEDFESYTVGNHIAESAIAQGFTHWTTWTNHPGEEEDGIVAEFDGTQCGYLTYGNDQVLLLGDEENGNYDLEFDIYIPEGKNGYFNILHHFSGSSSGSKWALECYLHMAVSGSSTVQSPGSSFLNVAGEEVTGPTVIYDNWMHFRLNVNTDSDQAEFYYTAPGEEEVLVHSWQWSLDTQGDYYGRKMAAMDFFPPADAETSEYYLDNFSFKKIGGESAPVLSVDPEEVRVELEEDSSTSVEVSINNTGNSIGDWAGWLEFGQGEDGSQVADVYYYSGETYGGIGGSQAAVTREIGIRLPASMYAGASMGMKITSAQFFVYDDYQSADSTYVFRIYGQGIQGQPGELLAEKSVYSNVAGVWLTATFDEPVYMTGQVIWATVQLEQAAGEYPLTMDEGLYGYENDGNWLSNNGGAFYHCYAEPSGSSDGFQGAWLISVNCEGTLIPATWVVADKTDGSILGGESEIITLIINDFGLELGADYSTTLIIKTNDVNNPHFEIPVVLAVSDGIEETVDQLASIYPNPATSVVTLKGENLNSVAIYNVAGQLVRVVKLDNMVNNIDMNVEAGVYFFSIYDNNGHNSVQRVVIAK